MEQYGHIRKSIIPDIQVKMLELCLSDGENGIMPCCTERIPKGIDYRTDSVLREVILQRIDQHSKLLPLTQRKKELYNIHKKNSVNFLEKLSVYNNLPIFMRKHLLCKGFKAG